MFGFASNRIKNTLQSTFSSCFDPLKDELGNVPIAMQSSKTITGSILGVCERYAELHGIYKPKTIALITDGVFEEVFRREATPVQIQVDRWKVAGDAEFLEAVHQAQQQTSKTLSLDWLQAYAKENFEPANNLML